VDFLREWPLCGVGNVGEIPLRRIGIVALARRLAVALGRSVAQRLVPEGAQGIEGVSSQRKSIQAQVKSSPWGFPASD
jgi:hypothetical protein